MVSPCVRASAIPRSFLGRTDLGAHHTGDPGRRLDTPPRVSRAPAGGDRPQGGAQGNGPQGGAQSCGGLGPHGRQGDPGAAGTALPVVARARLQAPSARRGVSSAPPRYRAGASSSRARPSSHASGGKVGGAATALPSTAGRRQWASSSSSTLTLRTTRPWTSQVTSRGRLYSAPFPGSPRPGTFASPHRDCWGPLRRGQTDGHAAEVRGGASRTRAKSQLQMGWEQRDIGKELAAKNTAAPGLFVVLESCISCRGGRAFQLQYSAALSAKPTTTRSANPTAISKAHPHSNPEMEIPESKPRP